MVSFMKTLKFVVSHGGNKFCLEEFAFVFVSKKKQKKKRGLPSTAYRTLVIIVAPAGTAGTLTIYSKPVSVSWFHRGI